MHIASADWAIRQFKGVRALARACGVRPSTISRLRRSKERQGSGGDITSGQLQKRILEEARARNLDVTAEDLILGREVPDSVPA